VPLHFKIDLAILLPPILIIVIPLECSWFILEASSLVSPTWELEDQTIIFSRNDYALRKGTFRQWSRGGRVLNVRSLVGKQTGLRLFLERNKSVDLPLPLNDNEVDALVGLINRWLAGHPRD
jgi:hypothetical protein